MRLISLMKYDLLHVRLLHVHTRDVVYTCTSNAGTYVCVYVVH